MNSCQAKKFRERFYLDCFLEKLALSPSSVEEKEPPDFLLCLNGRLVGVEVTYLHIRESREGGLLQVEESVTDKIVSEARSRYLESGGSPTHVTVLFSGGLNPKAVRRSEAAAFICEQVRRMSLRPMERGDWRSDDNDNWNHPFADVVHLIHALGVPDHKMGHWSVARAGWVATLSPEHLNGRISAKAPRIAAYREIVQECWLLIVSDSHKPSQAFDVPDDFPAHEVISPFSRTFYYRHPDGQVVEIGS